MRIMTDTSALFSPSQGEELGISVLPLSVTINHKTYIEFEEIGTEAFIDIIKEGHIPTSSQPAIGATLETLKKFPNEDIIILNMSDGLSGTYQSCVAAKNSLDPEMAERVHVINTMTLCGPHRYMVEHAMKVAAETNDVNAVIDDIHKHIANTKSFLVPVDMAFLKRGGRLSPRAAKVAGLLKIKPLMTPSEGGGKLVNVAIKRSWKSVTKEVIKQFKDLGVDEDYIIYVTHAGCPDDAEKVRAQLAEAFPGTDVEVILLSPVFVVHGGPGCIAIQMIHK
ncbi:MAG: DegV family protein [bacterium]